VAVDECSVPDIVSDCQTHTFSEGCGFISHSVAAAAWKAFLENVSDEPEKVFPFAAAEKIKFLKQQLTTVPSLFQIRYAGYKGTLVVLPRLKQR
jgi:hypothetical protein